MDDKIRKEKKSMLCEKITCVFNNIEVDVAWWVCYALAILHCFYKR